MLQSLLHTLWSSCHAESVRARGATRLASGTLRLGAALLCNPSEEGSSKMWMSFGGETTASVYWELLKFL